MGGAQRDAGRLVGVGVGGVGGVSVEVESGVCGSYIADVGVGVDMVNVVK